MNFDVIGLSDSESSDDSDEDGEGNTGEGILSGQHFSNLMREVHVLPASTLVGFGVRAGRESSAMHSGNDHYGFYFKSPVQLFKKKKKGSSASIGIGEHVWTSRPLVAWLTEAEASMRQSLLDAVDHCYNACALFSQSLPRQDDAQADAMASTFYTWLFSQPAQVVALAMQLLFTGEIESVLRLSEFGGNAEETKGGGIGGGGKKDPFAALKGVERQALKQLTLVTRFVCRRNAWAHAKMDVASGGPAAQGSQKKKGKPKKQMRAVPIAAASAYVSVLMHHRERVAHIHSGLHREAVVVPLSAHIRAVSPVDSFQWQVAMRFHLRTRPGADPNTSKPPSSTIIARSKYQQSHGFLTSDFIYPTNLVVASGGDGVANLPTAGAGAGGGGRRMSSSGAAGGDKKGPRPFLGKTRYSKQIEISSLDTTLQHGLEFYGGPEFRAALTPLTMRVFRSMIAAQKRFHTCALVSDGRGPLASASAEMATTVAEIVGRPHYRFSLGGNGMSSDRLHNIIATTVSTGGWVTLEDVSKLSAGVCSVLASCVVALDHARKANAAKVFIGAWHHRVDVVRGFNLTVVAPDFSLSSASTGKSLLGHAFHPIHVNIPDLQPTVEALAVSMGVCRIFAEITESVESAVWTTERADASWRIAHAFARDVATLFKEANESNLDVVSFGHGYCVSMIRSAMEDAIEDVSSLKHGSDNPASSTGVVAGRELFGRCLIDVYKQQSGGGRPRDVAHFTAIATHIFGAKASEKQPPSEFDVNLSKELDATFERHQLIATPAAKHYSMSLYEALKFSATGESFMSDPAAHVSSASHETAHSLRGGHRGVLLVGPSGVGKTTIVKCLADALSHINMATVEASSTPSVGDTGEATVDVDSDDSEDDEGGGGGGGGGHKHCRYATWEERTPAPGGRHRDRDVVPCSGPRECLARMCAPRDWKMARRAFKGNAAANCYRSKRLRRHAFQA